MERKKEGDFTRVLLVEIEKTATFFSGQTRRLVYYTSYSYVYFIKVVQYSTAERH